MSSSSTNNSRKWEQKYLKYKIKYTTIKKELATLNGGGPFVPVYKTAYGLSVNYELTDNSFFNTISSIKSLVVNNNITYNWISVNPMFVSLFNLYFNTNHKLYDTFINSNKGNVPSMTDIKNKIEKCVNDKFSGLKLETFKDKVQFKSTGPQDVFLSCCFKLSGNPNQVFVQIVDCIVKIFSGGKGFEKREYNVKGNKIVGLFIDNMEFACYEKSFEESFDRIRINVARLGLEDYYDDIIDNTEIKTKVNNEIFRVIKNNKIQNISPPNSTMDKMFKPLVTMYGDMKGNRIMIPSSKDMLSPAEEKAIKLEKAEREKAEQLQSEQEKAAEEKAIRDKAERDKAQQLQAQQEKAAREKAIRDKAERDKALELQEQQEKEKANREKAERDKALQLQAQQEKAARDKAIQEQALQEKADEQKAAQQKAAQEKAAIEKASRQKAAQEKAAIEKAARAKIAREKAMQEKAIRDKATQAQVKI